MMQESSLSLFFPATPFSNSASIDLVAWLVKPTANALYNSALRLRSKCVDSDPPQ